MKRILLVIYIAPLFVTAQFTSIQSDKKNISGISFLQYVDWSAITLRAKMEKKYIFIDCYATWCKPCKEMDMYIYPNKEIGDYVNANCISLKIQMDSAKGDGAKQKMDYSISKFLKEQYGVISYPTYLFINPDGELVHKETGFKRTPDFMIMIKNALNENTQLYTVLNQYWKGNKRYENLPGIIKILESFNEREAARALANDYINNYLLQKQQVEIFARGNLLFMGYYVQKSTDSSFKIFFNNADSVDKIMDYPGFSQGIIEFVIKKELVKPVTHALNGNEPDWKSLKKVIDSKYKTKINSDKIINESQITWYRHNGNLSKYCESLVRKIERYGVGHDNDLPLQAATFNNYAWEVFLHSKKKYELKKAIAWVQKSIKANPNYANFYDTYANLLYKLGKKAEAISISSKAVALDPSSNEIKVNYNKIKKSIPTW